MKKNNGLRCCFLSVVMKKNIRGNAVVFIGRHEKNIRGNVMKKNIRGYTVVFIGRHEKNIRGNTVVLIKWNMRGVDIDQIKHGG